MSRASSRLHPSLLIEHLYDPIVDEALRHWWNGELRRRQRRDIFLHRQGDQYAVEARSGGKDGTSRWAGPMTEQEALELVDRWQQGQDGWRETGGPAATEPA